MASAAGAGAGATTAAAAAGGEEATSGKWWVTSRDAIAPRRSTKLGPGEKEAPSQTVFQAFTETVNKHGTKTALCWLPDGANPDPAAGVPWQTMNWREYYHECIKFAKALLAVGFKQFEAVTIMGFNHKNWNIADLGCIAAGGLAAGIYTTSKPAAAKYIVGDCAARVAVIESQALLDNVWAGISEECESLKYIVVYGEK